MKKKNTNYIKDNKRYRSVRKKRKKKPVFPKAVIFVLFIVIVASLFYGCYTSGLLNGEQETYTDRTEETEHITTPEEESVSEEESTEKNIFSGVNYFIEDRMERYEDFYYLNPEKTPEEIVLRVNMNMDYDFYEIIYLVENPDDILVMCNKYYKLPEDFVPANLMEVPSEYHINDGRTYLLDKTALEAFMKMADDARKEGLEIRTLSAYRSYSYQKMLYDIYVERDGQEEADRFSARPGHSEHQTGLAVDVNLISQDFENLPEFQWLYENSHKYGYILRYKEGYEWETGYMYEPWHYRYVGKEVALEIHEKGITFDVYYAKYILPNK